jgi:hypothetical protein
MDPPTAFISYAWESSGHNAWVRDFATRLRRDGIASILDQWEMVPGDLIPQFMEQAVVSSNYVLIVCTPEYKVKSERRVGGVGYEGDVISGEVYTGISRRKFIPILRSGSWNESAPSWLKGAYYIDLRGDEWDGDGYDDLLKSLHGRRDTAPPVERFPASKSLPPGGLPIAAAGATTGVQDASNSAPDLAPSPSAELSDRLRAALEEIEAKEHGDMGSFYVRDTNSRRVFGRLKEEMASHRPEEILQALLPNLSSSDAMVRWKSLRLLIWWKLATAPIIRRFWEKEPRWMCRLIVVEAAQGLEGAERLDLLADVALLDDNGRVRSAAVGPLAALAHGLERDRVVEVLMELLDVEDSWGAWGRGMWP